MSPFQIFSNILLSLLVIGTITNLLTIIVCLNRRLRKTPTFVFILFMAGMYVIELYYGNLFAFYLGNYNISITNTNVFICKTGIFSQAFSVQASSWLLVAIDIERCLSVKIKTWRTSRFNSKKATIVSLIIISVSFVLNVDYIFLSYQIDINGTTVCKIDPVMAVQSQSYTYLSSLIPFVTILISNAILIHGTVSRQVTSNISRSVSDQARRKNMSISIVVLTFCFIIFTFPYAFVNSYYIHLPLTDPSLFAIIVLLCNFYYSANFFILLLSNKRFKKEFKSIYKFKTKNTVTSILVTQMTMTHQQTNY